MSVHNISNSWVTEVKARSWGNLTSNTAQPIDAWVGYKDFIEDRSNYDGIAKPILSVFPLVASATSQSYSGGILTPSGDLHLSPSYASVGQKISKSGVVSTYAILNTANIYKYNGGAINRANYIYFSPYDTGIGLRITPTNIVQTFNLLYSTTRAYKGAVLSPNGDIHFVPFKAQVGMKVTPNNVVSTYNLVYVSTYTSAAYGSYEGGILAPNGDIHFVPSGAEVGQKISTTGFVSTYSLPITSQTLADGAVLDSKGTIHFLGQGSTNISYSQEGIISTYSSGINSRKYGILAPDGNLHFIPYIISSFGGANVSVIDHTNTIISTYNLIFPDTSILLQSITRHSDGTHFGHFSDISPGNYSILKFIFPETKAPVVSAGLSPYAN